MTPQDRTASFAVGAVFSHEITVTPDLMAKYLGVSGDANPIHVDPVYAAAHGFGSCICYGNLLGAMVSHVVGMKLPVREVIIIKQSLEFRRPTFVGERLTLEATVSAVHEAVATVALRLIFRSSSTAGVCTGQCLIKCL